MAQTHKSMIYQAGKERGQAVASWIDTPELGTEFPKWLDWQGIGTIEDENDQFDAFVILATDAENNGRDFSPFEFVARELNALQNGTHQEHPAYTAEIVPYPEDGSAMPAKLYDVWDVYEQGIYEGIILEWNERKR